MGTRLILWDIDRTLIDSDGTGYAAFAAAFREFTGLSDFERTQGPGRTEWKWFTETLHANGMRDPGDWFPQFRDLLVKEFAERAKEITPETILLPGVPEVLRRTADHPDMVSSLLTGNSKANARVKMELARLDQYLDLESGAYGDDREERPDLVPLAQRRAHATTGIRFDADSTVLVGDSPNDIRAAKEGGARIVAVATGVFTADQLSAAGAPVVLDNLGDVPATLAALVN
ncbi:HAD hydrolase-like protein [Spiractinospora alimapuensis]|uniref:HAD family hydrolase n=1 Tax=Spiractinospora alimapuensis TaxID=2820884 RepID=UPI001F382F11|nr:HAD hydrolase-like protein [Spiractinospora alimapuensis]QVQ54131.1 HAD hydrolase-like protein [Spiractinospora alimapuensis]